MNDDALFLGREIPFDEIDQEICRVIKFTPHARIINNKVVADSITAPYAFLKIETKKFPVEVGLPIFHKDDFKNVFEAFKEKKDDQEVLIIWSDKLYKNIVFKVSHSVLPKIIVWLCQKEAYELMTNQKYKPELTGEARFLAEKPILEWKPEVME